MAEKKKAASRISFNEAIEEVETILAGLERDDVDIDRLGEQVKRAVELINVCRAKLEKTDREVRDLVAGLDADDAAAAAPADAEPDAAAGDAGAGDDADKDLPF